MRSTRSWPAGDEMTAAAIMEAGARRVELNRSETAAAPVLSVSNLSVAFETERGRVAVVRDVSFNLYAGRTLALVGESGSGKSVTSLSIMRLLGSAGVIAAGSITLATPTGPQDLLRLRESEMRGIRGRSISMIFQEPMTSLNPVLTVGHQIAEPLRRHLRLSRRQARKAAMALLDRVGIPGSARRVDSYAHEFSGGMRQRVMIAIALACRPLVMIADEPTTALDVTVQAQILELIRELQRETGMAVLFVTHNLGVVAAIADRTAVMYAGELMEMATTAQILSSPAHPYTRTLLASLPPDIDSSFDRERQRLVPISGQPVDLAALPPGCSFSPRCPWSLRACDASLIPLAQVAAGRAAPCVRIGDLR